MIYTKQAWAKLAFEEQFPLVKASGLSLKDSFMRFDPNTENQFLLLEDLAIQIEKGVQDFRRPAIDPSLNENGEIFYEAGMPVAIGLKPEEWDELAKNFMPGRNSRLGTNSAYNLFLGTLLKYLVEEKGFPVTMAWAEVCFSSELIANTANAVLPGNDGQEPTGSRVIGPWADLGNVQKIVLDDKTAQHVCRGCSYKMRTPYYNVSSLSRAIPQLDIIEDNMGKYATGWVIMDA